ISLQNSLKALLSVGELAHCRALAAPLARWSSSDSSAAQNRRQSPSRGNRQRRLAKNADNAVAMAKSELNSSELLASSAESALDELSGMVASPALASRIDDKLAAAKRRTRRSAAIRAAATRYLPALAAGEASVLLYCARRQAVLLHRSDPEAAARRLLADFVELRWPADIQRSDNQIRLRVWPLLERPLDASRSGLAWLREDASKLGLLQFSAGNPDLAYYCHEDDANASKQENPQSPLRMGGEAGQMERLVAGFYCDENGFLAQAEAALASSRTDLEAARQELSLLVAKLSQRKADSPESERYQFKRRLEGFDFSEKFIYDK
uniref:UVR domain-containing protein n=1 Tax=Macrostomum lignano TaxID=282301 RepID=A0A1I8GJZ7_9PLAT